MMKQEFIPRSSDSIFIKAYTLHHRWAIKTENLRAVKIVKSTKKNYEIRELSDINYTTTQNLEGSVLHIVM